MVTGSFRECFRVAWPLVLAMASNAILMFADRFFLVRYSAVSVQASLPAGFLAFMVAVFFQQIVAYSGTFVAQHAGAGARAACARAMSQGVWLALLCIPFFLAAIPLGNLLFAWAGHAPEVVAEERAYYFTLILGDLSVPFTAAFTAFFSGRGHTRLILIINLIGNAVNILLDPLFIWGWGVVPGCGITGAGIATALSQYLVLILLLICSFREPHLATPQRRRVAFAWQRTELFKLIRYGLPSGGHVTLGLAAFTLFVFLSGRIDALSQTTGNIVLSINQLLFAPLMGLGTAASILMGQRMGAQDVPGAIRATRNMLIIGWSYVLLCALGITLGCSPLLRVLYPHDAAFTYAAYADLAQTLIAIFLAWALFDTLNLILGGALKGAGDTRFVLCWIAGTALGFWLPLQLLCAYFRLGIVPLWLTMPAYVTLSGVGLLIRFCHGRWKHLRLLSPHA